MALISSTGIESPFLVRIDVHPVVFRFIIFALLYGISRAIAVKPALSKVSVASPYHGLFEAGPFVFIVSTITYDGRFQNVKTHHFILGCKKIHGVKVIVIVESLYLLFST